MKLYIASFFETRERLLPIRDSLNNMGHEVTSRWLDEGKKPTNQSKFEWWHSLAEKDLYDIRRSDAIALDTLDVNPRGGREVEWGYAYASHNLYIVGPLRNVFHTLTDKQFRDWEAALGYFQDITQEAREFDTEALGKVKARQVFHLMEPWISDPIEEARKKAQDETKQTASVFGPLF